MATHPPRLILGPADHGRPVSADEFSSAEYEPPWKYERVAGRLVVMPPDGYEHQKTAEPWLDRLYAYKSDHRDIVQHVFQSPWIRVSRSTDRIGDIGVYLVPDHQVPDPPDRPPDLMFEIVSPGRRARDRDYVQKRRAYQRLGIREYVIIDRFARTVTVLRLAQTGYDERTLTVADTYTSPLLPGLAIALSEVL